MKSEALQSRKQILSELGFSANAARSSWSHDLGDSIVFDAWDHQWERDAGGQLLRYPLRTRSAGYSLEDSRDNPRQGHTRWQSHVDLVLAGKRKLQAIVPVAVDPRASPNKGAKGWRPLVVDGSFQTDEHGQVWLSVDRVTKLGRAGRA